MSGFVAMRRLLAQNGLQSRAARREHSMPALQSRSAIRSWYIGTVLLGVGVVFVALSPWLVDWLLGQWPRQLDPAELADMKLNATPLMVILGMLPLFLGLRLRFRAKRIDARAAADGHAAVAPAAVLYLRSFGSDQGVMGMSLGWEQQLVQVLGRVGQVVAIGRPGERLPPVGALRCYVGHADWQAEVARRLDAAPLVFIRVGDGEGVRWEVEQAMQRVAPQRLVLLVPARGRALQRFAAASSAPIRAALERSADLAPFRIPGAFIGVKPMWLLSFASDGCVQVAGLPAATGLRAHPGFRRANLDSDLNDALRPWFEEFGLPWRPIPASIWRWFKVLLPLILMFGVVALMQYAFWFHPLH